MVEPNFCVFKNLLKEPYEREKIVIDNLLPKNQERGQGQVFQRVYKLRLNEKIFWFKKLLDE